MDEFSLRGLGLHCFQWSIKIKYLIHYFNWCSKTSTLSQWVQSSLEKNVRILSSSTGTKLISSSHKTGIQQLFAPGETGAQSFQNRFWWFFWRLEERQAV